MLVAEVAPAAPLAGAAVAFGAFCGVIVCWGLVHTSQHTIRAILNTIAWLFEKLKFNHLGIHIDFGGWAARQIRGLEHAIDRQLGAVALSLEHTAGRLWTTAAWLLDETGRLLAAMTATTLHAFHAFRHAVMPRFVHAVARPIEHDLHVLRRFAHASAVTLTRDFHAVQHETTAIAHELVHWRGFTLKQIRSLRRALARLAWLGAFGGVAALTWAGLQRIGLRWLLHRKLLLALGASLLAALGLSWLRCRNVGRLGRQGCRFPTQLLDDLLADALDVLVIADICQVARLIEEAALLFEPVLEELVALEDFVCLSGGASLPSAV